MLKILKTKQLEYEKSSFLIDIVQHSNNEKYVQIVQTISIEGDNSKKQTVKFSKKMLQDVINSLIHFLNEIDPNITIENKELVKAETDQNEIVKRYLKGVKIEDLSLQFRLKADVIEQILRNNDVEIVNQELPYFLKKGYRKGGRRRR